VDKRGLGFLFSGKTCADDVK